MLLWLPPLWNNLHSFVTMADSFQQTLLPYRKDTRDIVRVEKNLNSFGFFTPAHKRNERIQEKRVTIFIREHGKARVEAHATILPSAKLGLPTTADQDKYYAFQKLLDQIRKKEAVITNPVRFTSAEMLKLLGRKKSGQGYKEIADWMERMTLTGIRSEGVVWLANRKSYARDTFTVFSRAVIVGQELPSGSTAEQNYVWLSDWQLENLNNSYVLPIDYEVYRQLKLNISKALVPLIQIWFYAARRNPHASIEKRYRELCEILSIRRYPHLSKVKEVLGPSLDELKTTKILQYWNIERTADGTDFKLILTPGERFLNENRARLASREDLVDTFDVNEKILRAMLDRGIQENRAQRLLMNLIDDQNVFDQLEYGDYEIGRRRTSKAPILNPPGFYIYLVETNFPVPADFETSRKRELRRVAADHREQQRAVAAQEFLKVEALREEYERYRDDEVDRHIAATGAVEALEDRLKSTRNTIKRERPDLRLPEPALTEFALRRAREAIAEELGIPGFEQFCRERQLNLPL